MSQRETTLQALLEPSITALGYELWGMAYIPQGHRSLLRIYIDSPHGITVEDCERVSRQVSAVLDVEDPINGTYMLEVSSPGMDRPLFTLAQFQRFVGSQVNMRLHAAVDNQKNFKGYLVEVTGNQVVIGTEDKKIVIEFTNIAKANVLPEFTSKRKPS